MVGLHYEEVGLHYEEVGLLYKEVGLPYEEVGLPYEEVGMLYKEVSLFYVEFGPWIVYSKTDLLGKKNQSTVNTTHGEKSNYSAIAHPR